MRRALFAISGLAASTTALVVLKAAPDTSTVAQQIPAPATSGAGESTTAAEPTAEPAEATATVSPRPRTSRSAEPGRKTASPSAGRTGPSSDATKKPPAARPSTAAPQPAVRRVVGPLVSNEFGNVQVAISLDGARIVDAEALELPERTAQSDQRSSQVDDRYSGIAGLVVQRQSADLDTVSGATATSESYQRSLQAAIDRAR
ncbi:FMN-binding protein [Verrucosispora sp. WMMA2044]|uniref:FMN-binding protein n=1 Tax=Verrucosispora sp. WMMA2044 TaxID=3016419 RepID=UPI00248D243D|nr:FMN-binding protein [Verrucosispora sp. WMMA2044]WBB49775.1 FMN-binding protein [Verrucosispora sp. WMMA2044]